MGGLAGYMIAYVTGLRAIRKGMQLILRASLNDMYFRFQRTPPTAEEKQVFEEMYEVYEKLADNGIMEAKHEAVLHKEIKNDFTGYCKKIVLDHANEHIDKTDNVQITLDNVFIVWFCKTLQNWKALVSTTLPDGMYYEVTYNGDKKEVYIDAYKKFENRKIDKFPY